MKAVNKWLEKKVILYTEKIEEENRKIFEEDNLNFNDGYYFEDFKNVVNHISGISCEQLFNGNSWRYYQVVWRAMGTSEVYQKMLGTSASEIYLKDLKEEYMEGYMQYPEEEREVHGTMIGTAHYTLDNFKILVFNIC